MHSQILQFREPCELSLLDELVRRLQHAAEEILVHRIERAREACRARHGPRAVDDEDQMVRDCMPGTREGVPSGTMPPTRGCCLVFVPEFKVAVRRRGRCFALRSYNAVMS